MQDMPRVAEHLHYRIIDVSTVRELALRWFPKEAQLAPKKAGTHTALDDIRESIKELKFFKSAIFRS